MIMKPFRYLRLIVLTFALSVFFIFSKCSTKEPKEVEIKKDKKFQVKLTENWELTENGFVIITPEVLDSEKNLEFKWYKDNVVIPNETGFLIDSENEEEFVERLILLYKNADLRMEMGEKGHKFVINEFESNVIGDKWLNCYKSLF